MMSTDAKIVAEAKKPIKEKLIHVLYVDDETGLLKAAKPILEMHGPFQVETASSVKQAMQKMDNQTFDVIVSDYQMPEEDGLDFLTKLRKNGNKIPFILFTGKGREEVAIKALNLGADRYFNKIGRPEAVYGELAHGISSTVRAKSAEEERLTFKTIADKAGYGVIIFDLTGTILYVNKTCAKMHGYSIADMINQRYSILFTKDGVNRLAKAKKELREKGYVVIEESNVKKDGSFLPVLINATVIKDQDDSPLYITAVITDVTDQLTALSKLERKTEDLSLINSINDAINRSDSLQDVIKLLSNETKKLFAGSGATVYLLSEDKKFLVMQNLALSTAQKDKIEKLMRLKIPPIKLPLKPDSLYYQTLTKNEPQIINDPEKIQSLTLEFAKSADFVNKRFLAIIKKLVPQINRVVGVKSMMIVPLVSDGEAVGLVDISSKNTFTESDLERLSTILKPLIVAIKRRQTEEQLKESEAKYRNIFELSPDGIISLDSNGIITSVNQAILYQSGFSENDFLGKHFTQLEVIPSENLSELTKNIKSFMNGNIPNVFELTYQCKDGTTLIAEATVGLLKQNGKPSGLQLLLRDITERKKAEEVLKESEENYRTMINAMNDTVWVIDSDCRLIDVNDAAVKVLGYSRKELLSMSIFDIDSSLDPKEITNLVATMPKDRIQVFETSHTTKDGKKIPVEISSSLIVYQGKQVVLSIARDITERKEAEKELSRLSSAVKMSTDCIIISDLDGNIVDANEATLKLYGTDNKEDLIGKNSFETISPEEHKKALASMKETLEKGYSAISEYHVIIKNGSIIPLEMSSAVMKDPAGKPIGVVAVARDITERKRMEEALKESEERFRQVAENSGTWIWEIDANGLYTYASPVVEKILGYKPEEIVGKQHFYDPFLPEDREELKKTAFQFFAEKQPFHKFLNRVVHKNGKTVWLSTNGVPILDDNGNLLGYRGSDKDITDRKRMEEQLKTSEEKYRKQFETSLEAIVMAEAETGIIVDCNRAATKLFGRKKSELVGKHQRILHPPKVIEDGFSKTFKQHRNDQGKNLLEEKIITKNGEIRDVLINATTFELEGKTLLHGSFHDITNQKKAEYALRDSEKRFRELSELLPEVIFEMDPKGVLTFVNQAAFTQFGFSKADFDEGLSIFQVLAPEDHERAKENTARVLRGEQLGPNEYTALKKDGSRFTFIINSSPVMDKGKPVGLRGLIVDITKRKRAEEKLESIMDDVVRINEKLGVVGKLTRHDARNKLYVIANNVYLAKQKLPSNNDVLENLADIESAIDQIDGLFDFARTYEMLGVEELSYMNVGKSFAETVIMFSGLEHVNVVNECQGLTVMADSMLKKIFYNLIDDTLKHGEKVTKIALRYEKDGDQLQLFYEDNGVGVPDYEKDKIFKEGYGKGTGYGLYLITKICEEYNWTIQETGTPGKGAQFTMSIPQKNKKQQHAYILD